MYSEFINIVKEMAATEVRYTPNYMTAYTLARHPDAKYLNPAEVAFAIKIEVNEAFVKDQDFHFVITNYVKTLNNVYTTLVDDFPQQADAIFKRMVGEMSIKYSFD